MRNTPKCAVLSFSYTHAQPRTHTYTQNTQNIKGSCQTNLAHLNGQYILNPCSIDHNYCSALYQVTILNHYLEIILLSITVTILQNSVGIGRCVIEGYTAVLAWNLLMLSNNVSKMRDLAVDSHNFWTAFNFILEGQIAHISFVFYVTLSHLKFFAYSPQKQTLCVGADYGKAFLVSKDN